ncbi:hypothetical protein MYX82_07920 [Acidobacteria bacterium AH-259-D05]|nr:hypothetical protein [Acidobacteria bacterium AH-259-D05]
MQKQVICRKGHQMNPTETMVGFSGSHQKYECPQCGDVKWEALAEQKGERVDLSDPRD